MGTLAQLPDATKEEAEKLSEEALQKMKRQAAANADASPVNA